MACKILVLLVLATCASLTRYEFCPGIKHWEQCLWVFWRGVISSWDGVAIDDDDDQTFVRQGGDVNGDPYFILSDELVQLCCCKWQLLSLYLLSPRRDRSLCDQGTLECHIFNFLRFKDAWFHVPRAVPIAWGLGLLINSWLFLSYVPLYVLYCTWGSGAVLYATVQYYI